MPMYLGDIQPTCIIHQGVTTQAITTATTGPNATAGGQGDFVQGDGVCNLVLAVNAVSMTAITCQVQQSGSTNTGWTDITGASVTATTSGVKSVAFQRTQRYLRAYYTINGTTAIASALLMEQYKVV